MAKTNIRGKMRWGITGLFVLLIVSSTYISPGTFNKAIAKVNDTTHLGLPLVSQKDFRLGLDLQGGAHLVYEADVSNIDENERGAAIEGVRDVIERRVNGMGVGESQIQTTKVGDAYRIIVELPGVNDVEQAIAMIGETPILEFKEINTEPPRELTPEESKTLAEYNTNAQAQAKALLKKIQSGEDFESIAKESSQDEATKNNGGYMGYVAKNSPYVELYEWAQDAKENQVGKDLIESVQGYNVVKRGLERDGGKEVSASHILICYLGSQGCDNPQYTKEEALAKVQEVYNQATGDNFEQLAQDFSTDPSVATNKGDLGWFTSGMMIPEFEQAAFDAQVGQIIGPVETAFGYHIIYKKDERTTKEYEVWRILINTKTESDIVPPQEQWKNTDLSGKNLERSEVVTDQQTGAIQVALSFDDAGKDLFADITQRNIGQQVAIFLDGEIISAPTVQTAITDGQAVITGSFNLQEARLLSQRLNAGALPVPIGLVSQQTIGASLGSQSLQKGIFAGIIGLILVMIFMTLYYRLPGFIAVIALTLYVAINLSLFKLLNVTLTLSGITGLILSIGMAVDANILIFERLKEELREGKSLKMAVNEGFARAWTSIWDGNVATIITALLLLTMNVSFVKGFAVTLIIGTIVSMFTAITVTRIFLQFVVPWFKDKKSFLFLGSRSK